MLKMGEQPERSVNLIERPVNRLLSSALDPSNASNCGFHVMEFGF